MNFFTQNLGPCLLGFLIVSLVMTLFQQKIQVLSLCLFLLFCAVWAVFPNGLSGAAKMITPNFSALFLLGFFVLLIVFALSSEKGSSKSQPTKSTRDPSTSSTSRSTSSTNSGGSEAGAEDGGDGDGGD